MNKTNRLLTVQPPAPVTKRPLPSVPAQSFGQARSNFERDMFAVVLRRSLTFLGIGLLITAVLVAVAQAAR